MNRIWQWIFMGLTIVGGDVFAAPITSFAELTTRILEGHRFVVVLDLKECTDSPQMPVGYFAPISMLLMPASNGAMERVITSHLHFTDYLGYPTYEYTKYTFYADDTATIRVVIYNPQTFAPIGVPHSISCSFGHGIKIFTDERGE